MFPFDRVTAGEERRPIRRLAALANGFGLDLRLAGRAFRRQPGFTFTAVAILALGLGATTAMFSVANTLTLKPLPYPAPERLVRLYRTVENDRGFPNPHSQSAFEDYRRLGTAFEGMTAYVRRQVDLRDPQGDGSGRRLEAASQVSASFFAVHGVPPLLGRGFLPGEDRPGGARTVVLSWRLWQSAFGGDPGVLGRAVHFDGEGFTVVGVMPAAFNDLRRSWGRVALWFPLQLGTPPANDRDDHRLQIIGRLREGHTVASAQGEMDGIAARLRAEHGGRGGVQVLPLADTGVNQAESGATRLTLWLAILVLAIACFNLAGLQLARLAGRHRENAIRTALGSGRGRLVRQLLTESLLLCLVGGGLGLLAAQWVVDLIGARLVLFGAPAGLTIDLDGTVLAFAAGMIATTALAVGLLPAWLASRSNLAGALRAGGRGATDRGQPRLRHGLVVAEMALALVLLAAGGLFVRGLDRFVEAGLGWRVDGLIAGQVHAGAIADDPAQRLAFYERLLAESARMPAVESVSLSSGLPMSLFIGGEPFLVEGRPPPLPGKTPLRHLEVVSPEHFATLGMRLERGRGFRAGDGPDAQPVVVINRAMARALWPGQDPLGQRVGSATGEPGWSTVVGVVSDVGVADLREPLTRFRTYQPLAQNPRPWMTLTARTRTSPRVAVVELRQAVARVDPSLAPFVATRVREGVDLNLANLTLLAWTLLGFAVLGLVLAALGLYGLFTDFVVQRTREIGVRVALGAAQDQIVWMVLRRGLRLALAGAAIGLGGAVVVVRVLRATASELPAPEPVAILVLTATLVAVGAFACWLPARRAAALDPMTALRAE